jgi:hypothetical protein
METIRPFAQTPNSTSSAFHFVIHHDPEVAKTQVQHLLAPMFTDGSAR